MNFRQGVLFALLIAGVTGQATAATKAVDIATKYGRASLYAGGTALTGVLSLTCALVCANNFKKNFYSSESTKFPQEQFAKGGWASSISNKTIGTEKGQQAYWAGSRTGEALLASVFAGLAYEFAQKTKESLKK